MARDKLELESPVEDATASQDAAATPVAPEASQASGDGPTGSGIISEAESVAEEALAEAREELSEVGQAIWGWFNDHAFGTPISRATEALNYMREHAVPDLISKIERI